MGDYDSDEEQSQLDKLRFADVKPGMFVSGWEDPDDLIEEDKNPHETLERTILWAANENKISEIREILKLDASCVHARDKDGYTPLHRAAYNNFTDIAELLLSHNADPNAKTELGWTPLHSAVKWGNAECAALLLQNGADVNAVSDGLQTPLHIAATVSDCRDTATLLLLHPDIDAGAKNNSEETAADIARRTGRTFPVFEAGYDVFKCRTGILDI